MRLQKSGSLFVIYELLLMLPIEFDYKFLLNTGETGDVLPAWDADDENGGR